MIYNIELANAKLHISKGNTKLGKGIYSFSTLPGNNKHLLYITKNNKQMLLTDIPGTCSKHCEGCFDGGCYAVRDSKLHHNVVINAWGENTLLLRSGRVWSMLEEFFDYKNRKALAYMAKWKEDQAAGKPVMPWEDVIKYLRDEKNKLAGIKLFRINVSGEIEGISDLLGWASIARKHPEVQFGIYTKNYEALGEYLDNHYLTHPENFTLNVSAWHGVESEFVKKYRPKYPKAFNIFEYDDHNKKNCALSKEDQDRLDKMAHCPAVNREGHHTVNAEGKTITCDICGRCYGLRGLGIDTAVWSH